MAKLKQTQPHNYVGTEIIFKTLMSFFVFFVSSLSLCGDKAKNSKDLLIKTSSNNFVFVVHS